MAKDFFGSLSETISKTARELSGRAEEAYETQRIKNKISGEERQVEKAMADLGRIIYKRYKAEIPVDDAQKALCEQIDQRMEQIAKYKSDISELKVPYNVKEKGIDYYLDGRVIYLSVAGNMGKAIVDGTNIYEIEFTYKNGEVSNFICDCYCNCACNHIVAVIMQLKNIVKAIEENYKEQYQDYFSAVTSYELFKVTRSYSKKGSVTFN